MKKKDTPDDAAFKWGLASLLDRHGYPQFYGMENWALADYVISAMKALDNALYHRDKEQKEREKVI